MIGAAAFTITEGRRQRVEFTDAVDIEPFGFIYRRPTSISKLTFLIDPFEWEVWIGVAIMVTLIGTALFCSIVISSYSPHVTRTPPVRAAAELLLLHLHAGGEGLRHVPAQQMRVLLLRRLVSAGTFHKSSPEIFSLLLVTLMCISVVIHYL